MTTHIEVDPFSSNTMHNSLNTVSPMNPMVNMPSTSIYTLQNMMQMQIMGRVMNGLNFIKTGDPMIDGIILIIIQTIIIGFITMFMTKISLFVEWIKRLTNSIFQITKDSMWNFKIFFTRFVLCRRIPKQICRNVDIPYISDTRQINELYKAVFWYLTNDSEIDYLHEPYLQYVFDTKITAENKDLVKKNLNIHKILSQQKTKTISYKNHEIKYYLNTELITVYTDKDRKRENFKVNLSTIVNECERTDILDEFCQHCLNEYINNLSSNTWTQLIYTNVNGEWKSSPSNNTRKMDTIVLKKGLKDNIKDDLQLFLNSEEWYKERDVPYTRGYLFYGHPGTGKTSMIKGMSLFSKRHIHYLMLNEIKSDSELIELLKKINYKDTILVIEDIDAMASIVKSRDIELSDNSTSYTDINSDSDNDNNTKKHKNKLNKKHKKTKESDKNSEPDKNNKSLSTLTLSGLLNAIDGVFTCDGRILIMTTNHPEVLDSALIRPGRIDSKYLFDNCNKEQIKGLYEMFFNIPVEQSQLDLIEDILYSPAHITSVFLRYRNNPKESLLNLNSVETKIVITPMIKKQPITD